MGRGDAGRLNGLRCGELITCDPTDVGSHSWHHTLAWRTTKGDKPTVIALPAPTMQAIEVAMPAAAPGRCYPTPPVGA